MSTLKVNTIQDTSGNVQPFGITMQDSWIITSSFAANSEADITSNWARHSVQSSDFGVIGSAMTESSGIFTFPSTGIYIVTSTMVVQTNGGRTYLGMRQKFTTDNSNYTENIAGYSNGYQNNAYATVTIIAVYDVTNTSTHKIKFQHNLSDTVNILGNSSQKHTGATFTRLGDT